MAFFEQHVNTPSPGCKLWPFGTDGRGYGTVNMKDRPYRVCVLACIAHHGPRPPGMQAAHECGNRLCWAFEHVSWKTPRENAADKIRHGTDRRGEQAPMAKLRESQVREILHLYTVDPSFNRAQVAAHYGVHIGAISKILTGARWEHIPRPDGFRPPTQQPRKKMRVRLTEHQVVQILDSLATGGSSRAALARQYDVSLSAIASIAIGKNWKHLQPRQNWKATA